MSSKPVELNAATAKELEDEIKAQLARYQEADKAAADKTKSETAALPTEASDDKRASSDGASPREASTDDSEFNEEASTTDDSEASDAEQEPPPKEKRLAATKEPKARALNQERIETVERELKLGPQPNCSLAQRASRALKAIKDLKKKLKKANHGKLADGATCRVRMQRACALLSKIEVAGMQGSRWVKVWREKHGDFLEEKFRSLTAGLGWLYGVLADPRRVAANGGSMIGAERATLSGQRLRESQRIEEALAALKQEDNEFEAWSAIELERALIFGAVEARAEEWGGGAEGSTLFKLVHFAACYYGEALYLAFLVGGTPTRAQNDRHGWYYTVQQQQVTDVFSRLFVADGLSAELVPEGCSAWLRCYDPLGAGFTDYAFASETQFVDVLAELREDARGVLSETADVALQRAQAQAKSLRENGPLRLLKGGVAYNIVVKKDATGEEEVLCGRPGPHTSRLAEAILGEAPGTQQAGQPLQLAQTEAVKKAEVRGLGESSAAAEAALAEAAAGVGATADASDLSERCAERGQRLERELLPLIHAAETRLRELGLGKEAEAFVARRLALTMHHSRPDVKGGELGGKRVNEAKDDAIEEARRADPKGFEGQVARVLVVMRKYKAGDPRREAEIQKLRAGGVSEGAVYQAAHIDGGERRAAAQADAIDAARRDDPKGFEGQVARVLVVRREYKAGDPRREAEIQKLRAGGVSQGAVYRAANIDRGERSAEAIEEARRADPKGFEGQVARVLVVRREYKAGDPRREAEIQKLRAGGVSEGAVYQAAHIDGGREASQAKLRKEPKDEKAAKKRERDSTREARRKQMKSVDMVRERLAEDEANFEGRRPGVMKNVTLWTKDDGNAMRGKLHYSSADLRNALNARGKSDRSRRMPELVLAVKSAYGWAS